MSQRVKYELDPHNKLSVIGPDKFRTVLDGEFKLDDNNSLVYHVKKSDGIEVPQQVKFSGNWSLDEKHNLIFTLDKWNNQCEGDKLVLKSDLVDANNDELIFSVETRDSADGSHITTLNFTGGWQADKYNRLVFNVEKEDGASNKLILQGKWEINKQNEIVYTAANNTFTLRGHWDITTTDKLSYIFNKDLGSKFDLAVSFQKATSDSLCYGISVGYGAKKRTIALFGKWKVDKETGLVFEIKYAGQGVGVNAELSRKFLEGAGEAYIKTLVSEKEFALLAGWGFQW
jgi:hypothetical protein